MKRRTFFVRAAMLASCALAHGGCGPSGGTSQVEPRNMDDFIRSYGNEPAGSTEGPEARKAARKPAR